MNLLDGDLCIIARKKIYKISIRIIRYSLFMPKTPIDHYVHALFRRSLNLTRRTSSGRLSAWFPAVVPNNRLTLDKPETVPGKRPLDRAGKDGK